MKKIIIGFSVFFIIFSIVFINAVSQADAKSGVKGLQALPVKNYMTLSDAIRTAITNNPVLKASVFREKIAESGLGEAKSGFMPKLDFKETFNRTTVPMWTFGTLLNQGRITKDDFNPSILNDPDAINNFNSSLTVSMPVYAGGRIYNSFKQAQLNKSIAGFAYKKTRQTIIAETALAYTRLLLAKKNLEVVLHSLESAKANLKMVKSRYFSGFSVKSDFLRAKVRIADLRQQRLSALSRIEIDRGYLNTAMGIPLETDVNAVPYFKNSWKIKKNQDDEMLKAVEKRPELQILKLKKEMAEKGIKIAKSGHLPSINLFGTYENNSEHLNKGNNDYSIGAVMQFNLFSGLNISHKIDSAKLSLQRVNELEKNMKLIVKNQVREAFLNLKTSQQRIQVAESALNQSLENLRIVKNRYKNGLLTIVTLLDAELADQRARANHFKAVYDYESARIRLALASGNIDDNFN